MATGAWALLTSGSKSFNIPALTGAYGFISDDASREAYFQQLKARDGLSSPAVLAVAAHVAAYRHGEPWLDSLRDYLQDNLTYVAERLEQAFPALGWRPPQATYLAWIDLRPLAVDDRALQQVLIERERWRSCRALPTARKAAGSCASTSVAHAASWRPAWTN